MKTITIVFFGFLCLTTNINGQTNKFRPLSELINTKEPAWTTFLQQMIKDAKNPVEVLPKDSEKADSALYKSQVTTRSPMGAIVYETGGILINHGWIRILGSGDKKLNRNLMDWNKGKSYEKPGEQPSYLLIADDILGGFFAINAGGISKDKIGKVFYFAPDNLLWTSTDLTYTEFLRFCFSGDLKKFYEPFYWKGWEKDIKSVDGNQGFSFFPFLFTTEGKDIKKDKRKVVSIEELWSLQNGFQKELLKEK